MIGRIVIVPAARFLADSAELALPDTTKFNDYPYHIRFQPAIGERAEVVTAGEVQRVAADLFRTGSLAATVLGNVNGLQIPRERLDLD